MRRFLVLLAVLAVLTTLGAAPVGAQERSCVGWFASTAAPIDRRDFGAGISFFAHENQPFGRTTVAPFAHLPRESCPVTGD